MIGRVRSYIGCVLYLLTYSQRLNCLEIKCEVNSDGKYVCVYPEVPQHRRQCCWNHDLEYYYCCPDPQFRSESSSYRATGLVVAVVVLAILICILCIFSKRCPIRWIYLRKRRERQALKLARPGKMNVPFIALLDYLPNNKNKVRCQIELIKDESL